MKNKKFTLIPNTVDSRYLEFDGTMEKIWVNRSSTQEELWRYWKRGLFGIDNKSNIDALYSRDVPLWWTY